jgi:solute:Na+ symporter, SSS family
VGMYAWVKVDPGAVRYVALSMDAQDQAQNMFRALWCCLICVIVTVVVSYLTKPKPDSELKDLVYGLTPIPKTGHVSMIHSPVFWGVVVAVIFIILQIVFW